MRRRIASVGLALLCVAVLSKGESAWAFTSIDLKTFLASVTVDGFSFSQLSIQATALPNPAFFGKNVVIPVTVTSGAGSISPTTLSVNIMYQLIGPNGGAPLGPPISVPVTFPSDSGVSNALSGTALIPVSDLQAIRSGGQLYYIFVAKQGGAGVQLGAGGLAPASGSFGSLVSTSSFLTSITNTICSPVGPLGARVSAPDLFEHDGETSVFLGPGAVAGQGTLCITQDDTSGWPAGPGGASPISVYTITLDGASLSQSVSLALSYPSDSNGGIPGLNINPNDLTIFWLGPENLPVADQQWFVLSRATVDSTLHTVTGTTSHFSNFALFAPGGTTAAAATRPATRIITPNGDGINDVLPFASDVDEVKIFDVRGRKIRTIPGPSPVWDGRDDGGSVVESGVYIYQYKSQGERISGVVGVAK